MDVPEGPPPKELETEDIVEGEGEAAKAGDTLTMQYVGVSYSTGQEFDASWDQGQPFIFELGAGDVIEGWDEGLVGMREGGRRQLIIPPDMAYGATGQPPVIGPDETLIFVVDLIEIG
ncbi:MAG: FKBP-type peptidyl-prolyl cis-trans isomerase [Actinomycetota bacterium]|nr:FKBP-type peptidyl-prolyl cis-trans isomerase [Actinomycetota bacterium]